MSSRVRSGGDVSEVNDKTIIKTGRIISLIGAEPDESLLLSELFYIPLPGAVGLPGQPGQLLLLLLLLHRVGDEESLHCIQCPASAPSQGGQGEEPQPAHQSAERGALQDAAVLGVSREGCQSGREQSVTARQSGVAGQQWVQQPLPRPAPAPQRRPGEGLDAGGTGGGQVITLCPVCDLRARQHLPLCR